LFRRPRPLPFAWAAGPRKIFSERARSACSAADRDPTSSLKRLGWCGLSFFLVLMPAVGPTAGCSRWVCPPYYMDTCSGRVPASKCSAAVGQGCFSSLRTCTVVSCTPCVGLPRCHAQVGQMWPQMGPIAQLARRVALLPLFKIFILAPGDPRVVRLRASRSRDTVTDRAVRAHSMLVHTHTWGGD
jgi:hypothetical protein